MKLPTNFSFSISDIKNLKYVKKFKQITNSSAFTSVVAKIIVTVVIWVAVLIPTWLYLIIRLIAGPDTFWQELAIIVICMIVMGWIQVILAVGGFLLSVALILDDTI
jgi:uncharacterized membrane protein YhaH (DUF805 family)